LRDFIENSNALDISKDKFVRKVLSNLNDAAFKCNIKDMKHLVNCGNRVDEKLSIFGEAPIHKAILTNLEGKSAALETIIDCGADVDNMDCNGWTALHHAAVIGDPENSKILIESGANVNAFSNSKKTPLHFAALNGHSDVLRLLLESGGDIECLTDDYCTPLHLAARKGQIECVHYLLHSNANIYAQDFRQWTSLHYAAYNGHPNVVKILLEWDADKEELRLFKNS
jgi:ankyrin repeat protein